MLFSVHYARSLRQLLSIITQSLIYPFFTNISQLALVHVRPARTELPVSCASARSVSPTPELERNVRAPTATTLT